ncbi:MAG: hypothetical protein ABJM29_16595 [Rhizobiaceae bacterium]
MDSKTISRPPPRSAAKNPDTITMGKRHSYDGARRERMDQIAKKIGFTSEEILELRRIYATEFKGFIGGK